MERGSLCRDSGTKAPCGWRFFRFAACPLCNLRVHELIAQWHRFAGRINLIAVFQSPPERLRDFVATQNPPFTLVADPEMALYRQYGVESSLLAGMSPAVIARTFAAKRQGFKLLTPNDGPPPPIS